MVESIKEEKGENSDVKAEEKEVTPVGQQMMKVGNSTAGRRGGAQTTMILLFFFAQRGTPPTNFLFYSRQIFYPHSFPPQ